MNNEHLIVLKSKISQAPCLMLLDMTNKSIKLKVHTDVSQYALGGILLACFEGTWRLVAYHSCKFNLAEVNHSITKHANYSQLLIVSASFALQFAWTGFFFFHVYTN